ncbi:TerB family tellurite resistance protein [Phenylobacterium sp. LH3H17]|uniref:tellurite resistance TerB family protein n=1 Tax=Phenylobacterium sp. LH3H17 TaxID=2903901 RepID=UPI0020C9DDE2|nr:TerB family tellurite resistance protein [Phenylobacterium sp. LH3H17]UTP40526.1 TerB family tellurite resistance protein [Phenylobacterium sp. LH3H17]
MNRVTHKRRNPPTVAPADVWTPGDLVEMDALIAACALVAQADGWVTPDERQSMVERLRTTPAVALFGIPEVLAGFETLNGRFDRDLDDGVAAAEAAVRRLAGRAGPARLLVQTACAIAEADGGFDAEERDVILRLCDLLDLAPARFEIVAEQGRGR